MKYQKKLRIGVSIGDINGIGVEVFLKVCQKKGILNFFTPILFGSSKICSFYEEKIGIKNIDIKNISNPKNFLEHKVNIVNIWEKEIIINPGYISYDIGEYALASLESSVKALKDGLIDVLVTAPINKNLIHSNKFPFFGHTDYLENSLNGESLMFMIHEKLKIALFTDHVPLRKINSHISIEKIIKKIKILDKSLKQDFAIKNSKIAILGCNPHSGDNGLIGDEEQKIIIPAISALFQKGFLVFGPYSADSFFGNKNYKNFDAVLAIYHDQALIPFKTLFFHEGINFTAGLSHIRTSPNHGVAYDIAGKGVANETSFQEAIFNAIKIYHNRAKYKLEY